MEDILFAFTIAIAAFSGLDASSALAGEVAVSRRGLKRLFAVRAAAAVPYLGIGLVASSVLPQTGGRWYEAPMLGLVSSFDEAWLREPLRYLVAVSALALLVIACNAAMFGLSRLGYSLALNRQIPSRLGRLHPRFDTPVVLIALGALLAIALVLPADLELLAAIYAFGATLAFTLVHLSVLRLRFREPERDRPYKIPFGIRIGAAELPVSALLGALLSGVAFASVLYLHDAARFVGAGWLLFGVALYVGYRTVEGKPIFKRVSVPAKALTRRGVEAEFGSILVPVLGTPLDDDIMQTAGRLAGEENEDTGEGGAVIEALWVFEIPMALPLDARVTDAAAQGRAQGARARQGGGGGVRGRRGRDRDRARAPRRRGDRARGQAPRRRGDRARRGGADRHPRRALARRQGGPARLVRGRDDALRAPEGDVPRDPDRAAVGEGARLPDAPGPGPGPEHPLGHPALGDGAGPAR